MVCNSKGIVKTFGTVTMFSFVNTPGITGSVTNPTSTPSLTLTLALTTGNFASPNISQWVNDAGYLTAASLPAHNLLSGLQGGTPNEYYHLTNAQHTNVTSTAPTFLGTNFTAIPESGVTNLITDLAVKQSTTLTNTHILVGSGSNIATDVAMSGDATITNTGALTIANNAVNYAKFQQVAASSLIGNVTTGFANATGITLGSTLTFTGSALQTAAFTGDVTTSINSFVTTIKTNVALAGSPTTTTQSPGDNSTNISTTAFVTTAINAVLAMEPNKASCNYATTAALAANTYNNGASGVGATLTGNVNGALSVDGNTPSVGNSILVKNESATANNGIYLVTVVGSGAAPYVLTRRTDFDASTEIRSGDVTFITGGATLSGSTWQMITAGIITPGTTAIVWSQIAGPGTYVAGTGLTLLGSTFSITNTTVVAASYGGSTAIPTFTTNGQGQLTAAGTAVVIAPAGTLTGTTLASNVITSSLTTIGTLIAGAVPFSLIASGTNTSAAMVVGSGATLTATGTGTIVATSAPATGISGTLGADHGGTGIANNAASTLTVSGAFATTFTITNTTSVTFPTSGTLVNTAVTTLSSLVSVSTISTGSWNAPGSIRVNGATTLGVDCLANTNSANIGATLTSNTSGHHARLYVEVAGVSSGSDPFINFKNSNTSIDYALGYDTSATALVLSKSSTLGSSNIFSVADATLKTTFGGGDLEVSRSSSGAAVRLNAINTSNTASSNAWIVASVAGGSAGDAFITFDNSGVGDISFGMDNSAGDSAVISMSGALGTTDVWRCTTAGERTLPLQPAFSANLGSNDNDKTGDNTTFTLGSATALTEIFDQNSDFNTNGTFTAPITCLPLLCGAIKYGGLTATNGIGGSLVTSNRSYELSAASGAARDGNNNYIVSFSQLCDMDAADTATVGCVVFGVSKVADILSGSRFYGYVAC